MTLFGKLFVNVRKWWAIGRAENVKPPLFYGSCYRKSEIDSFSWSRAWEYEREHASMLLAMMTYSWATLACDWFITEVPWILLVENVTKTSAFPCWRKKVPASAEDRDFRSKDDWYLLHAFNSVRTSTRKFFVWKKEESVVIILAKYNGSCDKTALYWRAKTLPLCTATESTDWSSKEILLR